MKDERGLYYYPFPTNKHVRMYVRQEGEEIEFRLWNQDDAGLWDDHGWIPYGAIVKAQALYEGGPFDPKRAYDLTLAKGLIEENRPDPSRR